MRGLFVLDAQLQPQPFGADGDGLVGVDRQLGVRESAFDRDAELARLVSDLGSGQKVFLISPRRYGKSSLVRQALASLRRRGALTIEVTVSSYSSYLAFLEGYARAIASVETRWDRARAWLGESITATHPEVRYDPRGKDQGTLSVAFPAVSSARDISRVANDVFALPGRLATERGRAVVVALDEFQAVEGFNGGSVEHALRGAAQHQRHRQGDDDAGAPAERQERHAEHDDERQAQRRAEMRGPQLVRRRTGREGLAIDARDDAKDSLNHGCPVLR